MEWQTCTVADSWHQNVSLRARAYLSWWRWFWVYKTRVALLSLLLDRTLLPLTPICWPGNPLAPEFVCILANDCSEHTRCLILILFDCYCFVLYFCIWLHCHPMSLTTGILWKMGGPTEWLKWLYKVIRPPKMAILLLSVHPLLNQCLLHLHPTHLTEL